MGQHLSDEANAKLRLATEMVTQVLGQGGVPEIIIGAKCGRKELSELTYFVVSPLPREKILYVLSRVVGLLNGTIADSN